MKLSEAKAKALDVSKEFGAVQHVNFKVQGVNDDETVNGFFYVSDWYDSDCTVFSCSNGVERY